MDVDAIKAALDAHEYTVGTAKHGPILCACGFWDRPTNTLQEVWRAHVAEVIAALMPEVSVEWGLRYARDPSATYPINEQGARELAAEGYDTTAMQRIVWRGEWTEVTDA